MALNEGFGLRQLGPQCGNSSCGVEQHITRGPVLMIAHKVKITIIKVTLKKKSLKSFIKYSIYDFMYIVLSLNYQVFL